jgi:8-oxo-dGTP pyrophosphatase MutT (NUDIX family)
VPEARRHLTVGDVRERTPALAASSQLVMPPGRIAAAVLVPIFGVSPDGMAHDGRTGDDAEARVILTRRPETMPSHQGQVAFPGGKLDPRVDRTPRDAALREAHEEIGLPPGVVDVMAELPALATVSGPFVITPFVGILPPDPVLTPDPREVVRVFDVALSELLRDDVFHAELWAPEARMICFFDVAGETVWGATARVLVDFLAALVGVPTYDAW